ncbi:hypothetical protein CFC21_086393, partial [Triticum aestivum]
MKTFLILALVATTATTAV